MRRDPLVSLAAADLLRGATLLAVEYGAVGRTIGVGAADVS
jgi:hypothetical protein